MPKEQEFYSHQRQTEAGAKAGALMSLWSSFWVPVTLGGLFMAFDLYHVYTQTNVCGMKISEICSMYGFALLRAINNYFPSTLLPFAVLVVMQQGIYQVPAGLVQWKLWHLLLYAVAYVALFSVYIVQGDGETLLSAVMTVATIVFGYSIWLSLDQAVHSAPARWRKATGEG